MKHIFILNPVAGKAKKLHLFEEKLREIATSKGVSYEIYHTSDVGDASRFVRERATAERDEAFRFYACGGDGTVNEVVSGAVGCENAEVAIVPIGSGNDFVRVHGKNEEFLDVAAQIDADCLHGVGYGDHTAEQLVLALLLGAVPDALVDGVDEQRHQNQCGGLDGVDVAHEVLQAIVDADMNAVDHAGDHDGHLIGVVQGQD